MTDSQLTLEEKVDLLCEAVGVLLLFQQGFKLPDALLFNFLTHLGINVMKPQPEEPMQ